MIRPVEQADIPKILDIYQYYILHAACTFEETVPELADFISRVNGIIEKGFPYFVYCEDQEHILGYAYASHHRPREAYRYTAEVST